MSEREEVLDLLVKLAAGKLSPTETTDAIMSAFKRGAGVVVSDGFADLIDILERHVDEDPYTAADALDDLSKARAVIWRITSAVEPSCVLTDEMVEAHPRYQSLLSEFAARGQHNDALIEVIREASKAEETCKLLAGIRSTWAGRDPAACVVIAKAEEKLAAQAAIISGEPALTAALSSRTEEEAELARLREALTPSCETKAAYMGEFSFLIDDYDENGEEHSRKITVPWDTVKEIMAFIRVRSLTNGGE